MTPHLRILSRRSALAKLQAAFVATALIRHRPDLQLEMLTSASFGDRHPEIDLWTHRETGVFTAELSRALLDGEADVAVHSWKDLPLLSTGDTVIAATLERADPRDLLLVRREAVAAARPVLTVLSGSPRRVWQLQSSIARFLPWPIAGVRAEPVRGNVPTRLMKLIAGNADALVVAKAALDRLLSSDSDPAIADEVRETLGQCAWMVLPIQEFPTAPGQGALAIEVASHRGDLLDLVAGIRHEPSWSAVEREREILRELGGGCHDAVGATVLVRGYGSVTSVRAQLPNGEERLLWTLESVNTVPPKTTPDAVWPRPNERNVARRRPMNLVPPHGLEAVWVARAEAVPDQWVPETHAVIWAAGGRTWERLARRGIWVHGCADGLGDAEDPGIDLLAGRELAWRRLTHNRSTDPDALGTYAVELQLPSDLGSRTHFYWASASQFLEALAAFPEIRSGWHAAGPGRTSRVLREMLTDSTRLSIWLDYDQWHRAVTL